MLKAKRTLCIVLTLMMAFILPTMAEAPKANDGATFIGLYSEKERHVRVANVELVSELLGEEIDPAQISELRINGILVEEINRDGHRLMAPIFALISAVEGKKLIESGEATADELRIDHLGRLIRVDSEGNRTLALERYAYASLLEDNPEREYSLDITITPKGEGEAPRTVKLEGRLGPVIYRPGNEEAPAEEEQPQPLQPPKQEEPAETEPSAPAVTAPPPTETVPPTETAGAPSTEDPPPTETAGGPSMDGPKPTGRLHD